GGVARRARGGGSRDRRGEDDVDPVVARVERAGGGGARAVRVDAVATAHPVAQGVQRRVVEASRGEVILVAGVVSDVGVVGGDVDRVGGDRHRGGGGGLLHPPGPSRAARS